MRKHKIIYILSSIVLVTLMIIGMAPKEKKDIRSYLGEQEETISKDVQAIVKQKGIQFVKDKDNEIMEIQLLDEGYQVNGIAVGDLASKVYEIYPEDWIIKDANHIWVGLGDINHFGVVTEYVIFILDKKDVIQEIRLGYTTEFAKMDLPTSNQVAEDLMQGRWLSNQDRELTFYEGVLRDNILDNIWDHQYYTIIEPNKMIIKRYKNTQSEKLTMNFWVSGNTMYLFAVDNRGVPIKNSIETFIKQN